LASEASARVAASFISSLIVVARTSSAPRKMNGKPRTLFTWFGKSERPVATIASGRAFTAASYGISGSGFASAKIIGSGAIDFSISGVRQFAIESPKNTSAPASASAIVRAPVFAAYRAL
jgi:hypothetical protein